MFAFSRHADGRVICQTTFLTRGFVCYRYYSTAFSSDFSVIFLMTGRSCFSLLMCNLADVSVRLG
jgi:hypothetical protein